MLSIDQNVVQCLNKINSSTSSVMQTLKSCLGSVDVVEKIYTDVDVSLDLKKTYEQLQLNETHLTDAQKDLLIFLRANEKSFI
jgi:tRNA(Phe) wybutosine-synthesizing methylase Tyw3